MCGMKTIATLAACTLAFAVEGANVTRMDYPDADMVFLDDVTRIEYAPDGSYTSESDERILALMEPWPERFSIIYFYLSAAADHVIRGYVPEDLRLLDVGKPAALADAENFLVSL